MQLLVIQFTIKNNVQIVDTATTHSDFMRIVAG